MLKQRVSLGIYIAITILILFAFTGCAIKGASNHKVNPMLDQNVMQNEKKDTGATHSDSVVYRYIPVPIPGQLMAIPSFAKNTFRNHKVVGENVVSNANEKATQQPKSDQYFNSMLTYAYMPGAIYTLYVSPGKITDIILESGEKITNIAVADSANWQVQTSPSGTGKQQIMHILVKPMIAETSDNNIIVLTNQRTYHLYLKMTDNGSFMVSVRWHYPSMDHSLFISNTSRKHDYQTANIVGIDPSKMVFNYDWKMKSGSKQEWYPVQIFHDATKTYIRFPKDFKHQMSLPIPYVPDGNGGFSTMTNWHLVGQNTMVIDGVLKKAKLETGSVKGKRSTVLIRMLTNANT